MPRGSRAADGRRWQPATSMRGKRISMSTRSRFGAPTLKEKGREALSEHPQARGGEGATKQRLQRRRRAAVQRRRQLQGLRAWREKGGACG
jgi:hypothetical protein